MLSRGDSKIPGRGQINKLHIIFGSWFPRRKPGKQAPPPQRLLLTAVWKVPCWSQISFCFKPRNHMVLDKENFTTRNVTYSLAKLCKKLSSGLTPRTNLGLDQTLGCVYSCPYAPCKVWRRHRLGMSPNPGTLVRKLAVISAKERTMNMDTCQNLLIQYAWAIKNW